MRLALLIAACAAALGAGAGRAADGPHTPIRHVVVIFQENVSFDHYFATYPRAKNPPDEPRFEALPATPEVDGLTPALLAHNPNSANPFRLDRPQALTCDQDHTYTGEQDAYDSGLVDRFVEVARGDGGDAGCPANTVMGYFDGNTVTALWNYARHFAMSDNFHGTVFGPSTPGALNLVSGDTRTATPSALTGIVALGTVIGDADPAWDGCSHGRTILVSGRNVGDLLNAKKLTWGWFQGGFRPTQRAEGRIECGASHRNIGGVDIPDYVPHHEPFQYYRGTANPHHLPPESPAAVGGGGPANHQYDLADFFAALDAGRLPAVSYLKAPAYADEHPGSSDPLDGQRFLVATINRLMRSRFWHHLAIFITYDDSDGWYDHEMPPILMHSQVRGVDTLLGARGCGEPRPGDAPGRCGYGPRVPLLVISPWARTNYVSHALADQSSILRFIEDNWNLGRIGGGSADAIAGSLDGLFDFSKASAKRLLLDPESGEPVRGRPAQ